MMIYNVLSWYLTLQLFALAGLPLAFAWLRNLPSRGFAAAKVLGLLLSGVLLWWGGITHLWANTTTAALTAAGLLLGTGIWSMRGRWSEVGPWWREHRTFVIIVEGLFLVAFLFWAAIRATQPQLATAGGEKWMEIAFLNAVLRAPTQPPHDPWLSGFAISYYYLGYLLLGTLTRVAAVPSTIAFNLGNAAWFALAAIAAYGIVYDLLEGRRPGGALLAPFLLLLVGNGQGFLEILHARGIFPARLWAWLDIRGINQAPQPPFYWMTPDRFDWWQASRTLHDYVPTSTPGNPISQEVIDEFPAFSFVLGDMHPHLLALPFVLLAIALALNLWKQRSPRVTSRVKRFARWGGYALVLGALGFLNTWDFPIYWALVVAAQALATSRENPERPLIHHVFDLLPEAIFLGVTSVLLYLPFWIGLRSQAGGILPNLFNATHPAQFAVMFLPFLIPIAGILVSTTRVTEIEWTAVVGWTLLIVAGSLILGFLLGLIVGAPYIEAIRRGEPIMGITVEMEAVQASLLRRLSNPWTALLLTGSVVALILAFLRGRERLVEASLTFPALLTLLGLGLTLTPEFFFLQDIFSTRMNTIFKFYFQAWVLWSLVGAWWMMKSPGPPVVLATVARLIAALLISVGLLYTIFAIPARADQNQALYGSAGTLDGTAWLAEKHPHDWAAIRWLNSEIDGRPIILEAPGDEHAAYVYEGRISALTGLPTVLGWAGHENQWRGNYAVQARREQDLTTLFNTLDQDLTCSLLDRYNVTYVYVGPTEQRRYPVEGLEKFGTLFPVIYQNEAVTIYKVR